MADLETFEELLDELNLGSARGGRKSATPVAVATVRSLTGEDLGLLANPPPASAAMAIPQIKHQHHQIAGLLARGVPQVEISAITGYSQSYISILKSAPDMQELMEYYKSQAEERTIDALARLRTLGITSMEELQTRLNEKPEGFSTGQLMEMVELGIMAPISAKAAGQAQSSGGTALQINLNFKAPEALGAGSGMLIEQEAR